MNKTFITALIIFTVCGTLAVAFDSVRERKDQDMTEWLETVVAALWGGGSQTSPFDKAFDAIEAIGLQRTFVKGSQRLSGLFGQELAVAVDIEREDRVTPFGLKKEAIQLQTERQLRSCGIRLRTRKDFQTHPLKPVFVLYININAQVLDEYDIVPISTSVSFAETMMLARSPEKFCLAHTWYKNTIQMGPKEGLPEVAIAVRDLVQCFIEDYVSANP
jgi:hypothetical protein